MIERKSRSSSQNVSCQIDREQAINDVHSIKIRKKGSHELGVLDQELHVQTAGNNIMLDEVRPNDEEDIGDLYEPNRMQSPRDMEKTFIQNKQMIQRR